MSADPLEGYPRQVARTRGFTLGVPRSFRGAPDRSRGVSAYAADHEVRRVVFTVSGRPFVADLVEDWVDELTVPGTVDDPRLDPSGRRGGRRGAGAPPLHAPPRGAP